MKKIKTIIKGVMKNAIVCLTKPMGTTYEYDGEMVNRFVYVMQTSKLIVNIHLRRV